MATSRPSAVKRWMLAFMVLGTWPTMKWASRPTPSMGTPCDLSEDTSWYMASLFALTPSML